MSLNYLTLPVSEFYICNEDDGVYHPDDPKSFESAMALLEKLREQYPMLSFHLVAEIDA